MVSSRTKSEIKRCVLPVAWITGFCWLAVVLANGSSRVALGRRFSHSGVNPVAYSVIGFVVDTQDLLIVFAAINLLVALVANLLRPRRHPTRWSALQRTLVPTTALLFLVVLVGSVWATEHHIERGLYPTVYEFIYSFEADFALEGMRVFLLSRYFAPSILVMVLFAAAAVAFRYRMVRMQDYAAMPVFRSVLVSSFALAALCFGVHRTCHYWVPTIQSWQMVDSPAQVFFLIGTGKMNLRRGALSLFRRLDMPDSQLVPGAKMMGYPTERVHELLQERHGNDRESCLPHPLAAPIAPFQPDADHSAVYNKDLHQAIDDLSQALFEGRNDPIRLWLLGLESFRADDIHALHASAPPEIALFMSDVYQRARKGAGNVIVAERMVQGGGRTAQGVASIMCGIGTMPFSLSAVRDLGLLPLRCLPDVFKDASFRTGFYYGGQPSFDNMLAFFDYHGIDRVKARRDYVDHLPRTGWGWSAPDDTVFTQAFADTEREPSDRSQFNFVITLSNHGPFALPSDFPALVGKRVEESVKDHNLASDDVARLKTFSYSDWALERFVNSVSQSTNARNSMVVMSSDHSTFDALLWEGSKSTEEQLQGLVQVPFSIVFPEAFVDACANPELVRERVRRVNTLLSTQPVSMNDIPRMILALLMHSVQFKSIEEPWRWHTIGGQQLSPTFNFPGSPGPVAVGIDSLLHLFAAHRDGSIVQYEDQEAETIDSQEALQSGSAMLPAAALFSALVRGYSSVCWSAEVIRNRP